MSASPPRRRFLAILVALALALSACSASSDPADSDEADGGARADSDEGAGQEGGEDAGQQASGPGDVEPVTISGVVDHAPVDVEVGPVVREDELAVLRVSTEVTGGEENLSVSAAFGFVFTDIGRQAPDNLRLVDTAGGRVSLTAFDDSGNRAAESQDLQARPGAGPVVFHAVFAAPEQDTTAVLVPALGLVTDVPVVDAATDTATDAGAGSDQQEPDEASTGDEGEVPLSTVADVAAQIDATTDELTAPVRPLDIYREVADGDVRTRAVDEQVTIAIDSDVLFADDSADLSQDADETLTSAAAELAEATSGELSIVGHTDDVGTEEHNRDLSERRAQAVADRLGELGDLEELDLTVEGRAYDEPAGDGTSAQARALNRRVELVFTGSTASADESDDEASGELPPTDGQVGSASEGVVAERRDQEVQITVEHVHRLDNVLVGDLRLERVAGDRASVAWTVAQSAWDARGEFSPSLQYAATGVSVLVGERRVFPLDYTVADDSSRHPLSDLMINTRVANGEAVTATVVWPDVGADTVTLDLPRVQLAGGRAEGDVAWRIEDVQISGT